MPDDIYSPSPARRSGSGKALLLGTTLAFLLGAGGVGWLAWQGGYDFGLGLGAKDEALAPAAPAPVAALPAPSTAMVGPVLAQGALEERVNRLEDRLTRLDLQAEAASGNAARSEGLLIALAARRAIERGVPLGVLAEQVKLRFGDAQPNAVATVVDAAARPVTLDRLAGELEALAPALADRPKDETTWQRVQREVAGLFVIRKEQAPSATPDSRLDRARILLRTGRVEDAVGEVERMPGAAAATKWAQDARRYAATQKALDLIETTALLEPRDLKDADGARVTTPGPLVTPSAAAEGGATG